MGCIAGYGKAHGTAHTMVGVHNELIQRTTHGTARGASSGLRNSTYLASSTEHLARHGTTNGTTHGVVPQPIAPWSRMALPMDCIDAHGTAHGTVYETVEVPVNRPCRGRTVLPMRLTRSVVSSWHRPREILLAIGPPMARGHNSWYLLWHSPRDV